MHLKDVHNTTTCAHCSKKERRKNSESIWGTNAEHMHDIRKYTYTDRYVSLETHGDK